MRCHAIAFALAVGTATGCVATTETMRTAPLSKGKTQTFAAPFEKALMPLGMPSTKLAVSPARAADEPTGTRPRHAPSELAQCSNGEEPPKSRESRYFDAVSWESFLTGVASATAAPPSHPV